VVGRKRKKHERALFSAWGELGKCKMGGGVVTIRGTGKRGRFGGLGTNDGAARPGRTGERVLLFKWTVGK